MYSEPESAPSLSPAEVPTTQDRQQALHLAPAKTRALGIAVLIILALALCAARASGQFLDPDHCLTCRDVVQHAAGGAVLDVAARLVIKRPAQRVAFVAFTGAVVELAQWDVDVHTVRPSCLGKPGCGFGLKDLAIDVAAAVAAEVVISRISALLKGRKT